MQGFGDYYQPGAYDGRWLCDYTNTSPDLYTNTVVCLDDAAPIPPPPSGCVCPPVEPLQDRFLRDEQIGLLPGSTVARLTATCAEGTALVGGSCTLAFPINFVNDYIKLVSNGFARDMAGNDVWECTWSNGSTMGVSPAVEALCLRPPMAGTAPEAEPISDRLIKVEQRGTLSAGASIIKATCADGDLLLRGGCTLEDFEAAPSDLTTFRSGFVLRENPGDGLPDTWQCGWNNPSGSSTPAAIATALCVRPPATP